jgi:hypothetical protein
VRDGGESLERDLEEAISRALCDNLTPLQRTSDDLHQACADFVAACGSAKPSNALPALLRAQTAASSLASALSVLTNFVVLSMKPLERQVPVAAGRARAEADGTVRAVSQPAGRQAVSIDQESQRAEEVRQVSVEHPELRAENRAVPSYTEELPLEPEHIEPSATHEAMDGAASFDSAVSHNAAASEPAFDVTSFSADIQDLHRRANRVAKVAMQDIKLLRPQEVQLGRENKDICERLRSELDKARKEYDRRFRAIQDHPVDYFHRWVVEILAEGNVEALGEYPYPSPVLRH